MALLLYSLYLGINCQPLKSVLIIFSFSLNQLLYWRGDCDYLSGITQPLWEESCVWNSMMDSNRIFSSDRQGSWAGGIALSVKQGLDFTALATADMLRFFWVKNNRKMNKITKWKWFWGSTTGHCQDGDSDVLLFCQELRETSRSVALKGKYNFPHVLFVNKMVLSVLWWSAADLATVNIKQLSLKTGGMQKMVNRATAMAFVRADFLLLRKLVRKIP